MAMIQDHYEFNIVFNGRHLFATDSRSATSGWEAKRLYSELVQRFPESEGFKVQVTHIKCRGSAINSIDDIK